MQLANLTQDFTGSDEQYESLIYCYQSICHHYFDAFQTDGDNEIISANGQGKESARQALIPGTIVPISGKRKRFVYDFTRWAALYSEFPIFVLPTSISKFYDYTVDERPLDFLKSDLDEFIQVNRSYLKILRAGRGIFLPSRFSTITNHRNAFRATDYRAPLIQNLQQLALIPINPRDNIAKGRATQEYIVYKQVILPFFKLSNFDDLIKIARNETEAFRKFNHFLREKLPSINNIQSASELRGVLQEIDYEVANVELEYKKLSQMKMLQGVELGFLTISLCALVFSDVSLIQQIAGVTGSISILDILRDYLEYKQGLLEIKKNDFYLPFLLKAEGISRQKK